MVPPLVKKVSRSLRPCLSDRLTYFSRRSMNPSRSFCHTRSHMNRRITLKPRLSARPSSRSISASSKYSAAHISTGVPVLEGTKTQPTGHSWASYQAFAFSSLQRSAGTGFSGTAAFFFAAFATVALPSSTATQIRLRIFFIHYKYNIQSTYRHKRKLSRNKIIYSVLILSQN